MEKPIFDLEDKRISEWMGLRPLELEILYSVYCLELEEQETNPKYIRIKFCTQLPTATPTFAFFANLPQYIKDPYKRFIENKLRENFDFSGVPIHIYFRKK